MTKPSFAIVGDNMEVTEALRDAVVRCISRALRNCKVTPTVHVILRTNKCADKNNNFTVVAVVKATGKKQIARTKTTDNMYKSIDQASESVEQEIAERKEATKLKNLGIKQKKLA